MTSSDFQHLLKQNLESENLEFKEAKTSFDFDETSLDWSAQICEEATINDLNTDAILFARKEFLKKSSDNISPEEINLWSDEKFLNKAKLTIGNKITNTAIILLGNSESVAKISPSVAQITWILKGENGIEKDYTHFSPPFLLAVNEIYTKIRNLKYRYIQDGTLFPQEVNMYESYSIREALHNCIAHQDYSLSSRITVLENESGYLLFSNAGSFLPKTVEKVIHDDIPQQHYRNKFLIDAMVNINMIDTIGSGIRKMFLLQKDKFFPLPSYSFKESKVEMKLIGKILDINYSKLLAQKEELSLEEIILLDQIQKKNIPSKETLLSLRSKKLIEGRIPNIHISDVLAKTTDVKDEYMRNKGFDDKYYKDMIFEYIKKFPQTSRKDIEKLILPKLPEILNDTQKQNKIRNIIHSLSKKDKIENKGTGRYSLWSIKYS